uniref:Uncharacterized protein n=1 Tax=Anguilla anguilla TaxID=7936 RepID=A0A0E9XYV9_ANGAN
MYKEKVLGKFCGQKNSVDGHHPGNEPILSPGNHLHVIFQTDDSNAGAPPVHWLLGLLSGYRCGRVCLARTGRWLGTAVLSDLPQYPGLLPVLLSPWLRAQTRPANL